MHSQLSQWLVHSVAGNYFRHSGISDSVRNQVECHKNRFLLSSIHLFHESFTDHNGGHLNQWNIDVSRLTLAAHVSAMDSNTKFAISSRTINSAIAHQNKLLQNFVGANLSAEQENAIRHVLGSKQLYTVIDYAGSGISTMLAAARNSWEIKAIRVIGAALSGKAADGLE